MAIERYQAPSTVELKRIFRQMGVDATEVTELLVLTEGDVERKMSFAELFTLAYRVNRCEVEPGDWRGRLWVGSSLRNRSM